ncbi:MAG TPA: hypothetical protein VGB75_17950 [Jatrophihabitans sp.]|jgi:hypothetical protein|uniref:hypothetical protein n=1 Tax=Jatrophihabitans sp. TaxID=1932789 RepID=UPI002EDE3773
MTVYEIESFALLAFLSLTYSASLMRIEKLRRVVSLDRVPDMLGVWTFAATVTLPPALVAAFVVVANLGEWPSRKAYKHGRPAKYAVSTVATATWCVTASEVVHRLPMAIGVPLGVLTFCALSIGFIAFVVYASGQGHILGSMMSDPKAHLIEIGTQGIGAALGVGMLYLHPTIAVGALVLLYGLHLASLRHVVEVEDAFDPVTGLWSEEAWMVQAQQRLHDVYGSVALFMIDPDEAGQEVRILQTIESGLQPTDLLGRYGSRQILVLIPVGLPEGGPFLATGFRKDLAAAGVRAALGCATTADAELEGLLIEAMSDLMGRRDAAGITRNW